MHRYLSLRGDTDGILGRSHGKSCTPADTAAPLEAQKPFFLKINSLIMRYHNWFSVYHLQVPHKYTKY
jgi:hypothetical protein